MIPRTALAHLVRQSGAFQSSSRPRILPVLDPSSPPLQYQFLTRIHIPSLLTPASGPPDLARAIPSLVPSPGQHRRVHSPASRLGLALRCLPVRPRLLPPPRPPRRRVPSRLTVCPGNAPSAQHDRHRVCSQTTALVSKRQPNRFQFSRSLTQNALVSPPPHAPPDRSCAHRRSSRHRASLRAQSRKRTFSKNTGSTSRSRSVR